jgi:hypothetical protein
MKDRRGTWFLLVIMPTLATNAVSADFKRSEPNGAEIDPNSCTDFRIDKDGLACDKLG